MDVEVDETFDEGVQDMYNNIIQEAENLLPLCEGDKAEEMKLRLERSLKDLITSQLMVMDAKTSLSEMEGPEIDDKHPQSSVKLDKAMKVWAEATKKKLTRKEESKELTAKIENHEAWIKLHEVFNRIGGDVEDEEDDKAGEEEQSSQLSQDDSQELLDPDEEDEAGPSEHKDIVPQLDPISMQRLTDPIKNQVCGHIYGKASMLGLLAKRTKMRCPAMGCTNRNYIRTQDLIEDQTLTRLVQKRETKLKSKSKNK